MLHPTEQEAAKEERQRKAWVAKLTKQAQQEQQALGQAPGQQCGLDACLYHKLQRD